MKELVSFELPDGGAVVVEVEQDEPGYERVARRGDEIATKAGTTFDSALDVIRPTAAALVDKLESLARTPSEVTVEFGIRMNFKAGAVIASSEADAHLQVTLTWTDLKKAAGSPGSSPPPAE